MPRSHSTRGLRLCLAIALVAACSQSGGSGDSPVGPGGEDTNRAPLARINTVASAVAGSAVTLDGSGSNDPDGDQLSYAWTLITPQGSQAQLTAASAVTTTFMPDIGGEYRARLTVSDGTLTSSPDSAAIDVEVVFSAFQFPPVDLSKVAFIEPMGSMIGNHVTPIDHQYYPAKDFFDGQNLVIDVYSPGSGRVTEISHMGSFDGTMDDYRFVIQHTPAISSVYIHVDGLSTKLQAHAPAFGQWVSVDIPVSAGEIIGTYSGSTDYNVVDADTILPGFINPASYTAEPWKIHVPDPFDYFEEGIAAQLRALCLRTAQPEGGKIDYDIPGKAVGNWFKEGTNGYQGLVQSEYWVGHLSITYSSVDPAHVMISLGDFQGEPKQFGVTGNAPDPATVEVSTGPVAYELVDYDFWNGDARWDRATLVQGLDVRNGNQTHGVVLVQLLEVGRLKVELFPGAEPAAVTGFTQAAEIYVR